MPAKQKNKKGPQRPNRTILRRTLILLGVCGVVAFVVLGVKLYNIQIIRHDYYEERAVEQQTKQSTITASRGTIYDTNGKVLAMSASVENVFISPREIIDSKGDQRFIAENLAAILDVDADSIITKMQDTASYYKTVKTQVEQDLADQVREFITFNKIRGVYLEPATKRYYPHSSLASHVIGYVGSDNQGLNGIEYEYNSLLTGTNGRIVNLKNAKGTDMLFSDFSNYYDARNGDDVTLTIDSTVQYYVEKYLAQAVADYDVLNGACCIVMNPKTGGIMALANLGSYDPNNWQALEPEIQARIDAISNPDQRAAARKEALNAQWRNKTVSDTYEPGSVFKIITLSAALEEGVVTPASTFYCDGSIDVLGRTAPAYCWRRSGHGSQTLAQTVENSCNVGFVQIGLRVGAQKMYEYIDAFGFFDRTGIDLPGEAGSQWWPSSVFEDPNNQSSLAAASFGQTFNITPVQMLTAVCAATNGGYLMKPHIVQQAVDADGNVVFSNQPTVVRQAISKQTSDEVASILEKVVSQGTGKNAQVRGYRVGGKTGTSEKVAKNLQQGTSDADSGGKEYIVSFCGVAPMDDPQVAILLLLDTPSDKTGISVTGGVMAAPVAGMMLSDILPYLGVQPEYTDEERAQLDVSVPNLAGMTVVDAKTKLQQLGLSFNIVGDGPEIAEQLPAANTAVAPGTKVILYTEGSKATDTVTVPDLAGKSYATAKAMLESAGLFIRSNGALPSDSNIVVSTQSVAKGASVPYGSVVAVTLVDSTITGIY